MDFFSLWPCLFVCLLLGISSLCGLVFVCLFGAVVRDLLSLWPCFCLFVCLFVCMFVVCC